MRFLVLTLALLACVDAPDSVDPPTPPASVTQQPEARSRSAEVKQPTAPPLDAIQVRLEWIGEALAEDGMGSKQLSGQAVQVDIESAGWPGRAMEPVLHVGQLRFNSYSHVSPTVLRYVVDGPDLLPQGAEASVRYGSYEAARFILPAVER